MPDFVDIGSPVSEPDAAAGFGRMSPFSVLSVIRTLWKRKILVLFLWAVGSAMAFAVAYSLPSIYRSEAKILIESQRIPERFVPTTVNVELQARLNTIGQEILSYDRLLEIIQRFDLYRDERKKKVQEEIIEMMRSDIKIDAVRDWSGPRRPGESPGAFQIAYQGPNPAVVAQVAAQLSNLFIDENLLAREKQALGTSSFLDNQLADAKRRLEEQEKLLGAYKLQHNGELPEQENALIASLGRLQQQLSGAQDAENRAEQSKLIMATALETAQASEAALTQMAEQIASARAEGRRTTPQGRPVKSPSETLTERLEELRRHYTDAHPDIKRLKQQLEVLEAREKAVQQGRAEGGNGTTAPLESQGAGAGQTPDMTKMMMQERQRVEMLRAQSAALDNQIKKAQYDRVQLSKQIDELQKRIEKLPLREQEMAALMRDYQISSTNYRSLLDKKLSADMAADMEKRSQGERFRMLEAARVPERPIRPNRQAISLYGSVGALILALAAGFARESKSNAVLGEWELPRGVVVLGRVPLMEFDPEARARRRRSKRIGVLLGILCVLLLGGMADAAVYFGLIRF